MKTQIIDIRGVNDVETPNQKLIFSKADFGHSWGCFFLVFFMAFKDRKFNHASIFFFSYNIWW